jgi:hypothetical protein
MVEMVVRSQRQADAVEGRLAILQLGLRLWRVPGVIPQAVADQRVYQHLGASPAQQNALIGEVRNFDLRDERNGGKQEGEQSGWHRSIRRSIPAEVSLRVAWRQSAFDTPFRCC